MAGRVNIQYYVPPKLFRRDVAKKYFWDNDSTCGSTLKQKDSMPLKKYV